MNTQERSTSEYASAWQSHINTLNRLRWNLPKKADQEKLDRLQSELNDLVGVAVKDLIQKRQVKESMAAAGVDEDGN